MIKLVVGILKGAIIGAGVGYGAFALGKATGFESPWITYGVIGALVGLIAGRSIWSLIRDKNATSWVGIVRSVVGFGVGCGLYALVDKVIHPTLMVTIAGEPINVFAWTVTLGGAIGALWGGFVEIDDAIGADSNADKKAKAGKAERELPEAKPAGKPVAKRPAGK